MQPNNPQYIASTVLQTLQDVLGAGNVVRAAQKSEPTTGVHFDPSAPAHTEPLVQAVEPQVHATHTFQQRYEM